jgi:hypothetical protein
MRRLVPYGKSIPGSTSHIKHIRQNVLSMINSPVILEKADFTMFSTVSDSDLYDACLYAIIVDDSLFDSLELDNEYDERHKKAKDLDLPRRKELLKQHPALVCRVFHLKQHAIDKCILFGDDKPLGKVTSIVIIFEFIVI